MTDRFQRIADIWSWLPAFRAVAETEHLPTASSMIHVSNSALSRSVNQLEEYLGHSLFDRKGRSLVLNERGERLLKAVRNAMRRVDDAVDANLDETYRGRLRWTSSWSLSGVTVEALDEFVDRHPGIVPQMYPLEPGDVADDLLRGELDLAVMATRIDRDGLETRSLGSLPHSVYCGDDHALFGRDDVGMDELEGEEFAAPVVTAEGQFRDGWPADRPRKIVMQFSLMAVGFRACRDHGLLAVLPDIVAQDEQGLWQLQTIPGDHRAYALHRTSFEEPNPAAELADLVAELIRARQSEPATAAG